MRLDELINGRRWEVVIAAHEASSMGELCSRLGASNVMTRRALTALGIKKRWKRGCPPGHRRQGKVERDAAVIVMREQTPPQTMQEISEKFEISRERARQILNKCGRVDLCSAKRVHRYRREARLVDWMCANCDKSEKRLPRFALTKWCSWKCRREYQYPIENGWMVFGPRILELREDGMTWADIGQRIGFRSKDRKSLASQACRTLKRWGKRVDADLSHLQRHGP